MKRYYYLLVFFSLVGFLVWYVPLRGFGEPPLTITGLTRIILPWRDTAILADMFEAKEYFVTLVVVCSAAENYPRRQAIRQTWGRIPEEKSFKSAKVIFLLGRPLKTPQTEIENEFDTYRDIIQEDFLDTYNNLSLKSVFMLKQFVENYKYARFLLKTDDDVIIQLNRLFDFIHGLKNRENVLVGHRNGYPYPRRDRSKWFISYKAYPYPAYPNYLDGPCYLMDRMSAEKLYYTALDMDGVFHLEDVFITGFVAEKAEVTRRHAEEFDHNAQLGQGCGASTPKYVVGGHGITAQNLTEVWRDWDPEFGLCLKAQKS